MIKAACIFPGQGAQYVGMGRDLAEKFPAAAGVYREAGAVLGFDLAKVCFNGPEEELVRTEICQPAILATSMALWKVWEPVLRAGKDRFQVTAAAGLSLGEYSALVGAGCLDFGEAIALVRDRGAYMEETSRSHPGQMASIIGLAPEAVGEIARATGVEIANRNCPGQVVVSGGKEQIAAAVEEAGRRGAGKTVLLQVSGAFHSSLMKEAADKLARRLSGVRIAAPKLAFVDNVNARYQTQPEEIKKSLAAQVMSSTHWEDTIRLLAGDGIRTYFEIGPGKVLKGLLRRIDPGLEVYSIGTAEDIERAAAAIAA